MDILNKKIKCLELVNSLEEAIICMEDLEREMNAEPKGSLAFQRMYEEEFRIAMEISGIFEDIHVELNRLENDHPEYKFFCSRIRKEVDGLVKMETIIGD